MEAGFKPYATSGHWGYSNEGWVWQSNYNWGWAPFHYGRWLYDDMYGWLWIPGYDWAPAWVTWGSVGNNYAWAPLMPEVNVGVQFGGWRPHVYYWNICGREHIYDRNISIVLVNNVQNNTTVVNNNITKNITIINNYNTSRTNNYYSKGPDVNEVQQYTPNKIEPVAFKDVNNVKQQNQKGNVMEVYRPIIQKPQTAVLKTEKNNAENFLNSNNQLINTDNKKNKSLPALAENLHPQSADKTTNNTKNIGRNEAQVNLEKEKNDQSHTQYQNPQPHKFRKAELQQIKPVHINSQQPFTGPKQQRKNIQQLPIQKYADNTNNFGNKKGNNKRDY